MPRSNKSQYPCLVPRCTSVARFFAFDNRARYGHVCRGCHSAMTPQEQALYVKEK